MPWHRASVLALALCLTPTLAGADVLLTPYLGWNRASSGIQASPNLGAAVAWTGTAGIGVELDFSGIPNAFDHGGTVDRGRNYVFAAMGNLVVDRRVGGIAPYLTGGLGLLRLRRASFVDSEDNLAANVGGGLRVGTGRVALRADARYFRTLTEQKNVFFSDPPAFTYWRGTVGLSIRF